MSLQINFDCRHRYESGFQLAAQFATEARITAIVGPSGSGKTTILKLIAGLLRPDEGSIQIGDLVVTNSRQNISLPPERRNVGLLFQNQSLFPHLRIEANLRFGQKRRGRQHDSFDHVVATLELTDLLRRFPQSLSGGQQQRVALGRAILSNPTLLLLDEPTTSVEPELIDRIRDLILHTVQERDVAVILVSHNQSFVSEIATNVITIDNGKL